jgi:hypothetical protein
MCRGDESRHDPLGTGRPFRNSQGAPMSRARFLVCLAALAAGRATAEAATPPTAVLTVSGDRFLLDGKPFEPWGIRVASAARDAESTRHLIAQLDDYRRHGVNSFTVFYQGSSGGYGNPFSADGTSVEPEVQARMIELIREAEARRMVVVVGIFYQRAPFPFRDKDAVRRVVRTVAESLRPHRNVILNIANEQNSPRWQAAAGVCDFRDPQVIIELCRLVREIDPARIVGGGGYDHAKNEIIGRSPHVGVLLFDTSGPTPDSGALYERFLAAGVREKPMINVETFGGWTRNYLPPGVFPDEVKAAYRREVEAAARRPGLSVFFHNNPWCQGPDQGLPRRYDLGGAGTPDDPGIRWYFERVRQAARPDRAAF